MATKLNVAERAGVLFDTADATPIVAAEYQTVAAKLYWFEVKVTAVNAAGTEGGSWWRQAAFRTATDGTLTQVGSTRSVVTDNEVTGGQDVTVAASGTKIQVTVTGIASTLYWRVDSKIDEVDFRSVN